jgi:hypothetical protein
MSPLSLPLDQLMYGTGQLFLLPVLACICLLFLYAFTTLGAFGWQAFQRHLGNPGAYELLTLRQRQPATTLAELEAQALNRLEFIRIATRITPMLGLVATMIPMGPALRALGDGQLADVANNLTVAFSAVILALLASAITYAIAHVRRRWYADELLQLELSEGKTT